jgi:hypothetical protein
MLSGFFYNTHKKDGGMKKYLIGGKEFEMQPLTLRQRQLAAPVQKKLMEVVQRTLAGGLDVTDRLDKLLEISFDLDSIIVADDQSFEKFLATILTPVGKKWSPDCIEKNMETMLDIDEITQAEVLQDFLSRRSGSTNGSQSSMNPSPSAKKQSGTNKKSDI